MRVPAAALFLGIVFATSAGAQVAAVPAPQDAPPNAPMRGPNGRYHVLQPGIVTPRPPPAPPVALPPAPDLKPYVPPPVPVHTTPPPQPDAVVATSFGQIGGDDVGDGTWTFKAIPFAKPPVGDLRWTPPQDPDPWQGVRYSQASAPACLQVSYGWNADLAKTSAEDCLYLELRTPALDVHAKKPVMVFIHGGANRAGGATGTIYSGFASKDVVIVSLQYRLGVFGFMSHPALTQESPHRASGNYALLDLMQALYWIKDNIAQFGGDPGNVTVFGHSAGGGDVGMLLSSPLARGLFNKAIIESGPPQFGFAPRTLAQNETLGSDLAARFSTARPDGKGALADLRHAPAAQLQAAADTLDAPIDDDSFIWDQATVDGYVLPRAPEDVFRAGKEARVPLLIGVSAQEIGLHGGDDAIYRKIYDTFGDGRFRAMRLYGVDVSHRPKQDKLLGDTAMQVSTDTMMRCPSDWVAWHHTAAGMHAWFYQLDVTEGEGPVHHGSELSYVMNLRPFGKHDADWPPLQDYWVNFARSGNPNGPDAGGRALTGWPAYGANQSYIEFTSRGAQAGRNLRGKICALLDRP